MGVVEGCVLTLVEAWVGVASPMAWAVALEVEVSLKKKQTKKLFQKYSEKNISPIMKTKRGLKMPGLLLNYYNTKAPF